MLPIRAVLALILLHQAAFADTESNNRPTFKNFYEWVTFEPIGDGSYRRIEAALRIQAAPRPIVKTPRAFPGDELIELAPGAIQVTNLFLMPYFGYFLLRFERREVMLQILSELQAHLKILLVQPDIQQQRNQAEKKSGSQGSVLDPEGLPRYRGWSPRSAQQSAAKQQFWRYREYLDYG